MQKLYFLLSFFCCFMSTILTAQTSIEFAQSEFKFEARKNIDQVVDIPVKISGAVSSASDPISLSIVRNDKLANYSFVQDEFTVHPNVSEIKLPFNIRRSTISKNDTVSISFTDPYGNKIRNAQIFIRPEPEESTKGSGRLMLLNAYNLDFGGNLNGSNYVGHLNIFSPSMGDSEKWGFNTGIMRINYAQKDTALESNPVLTENFFINHFDTVGTGLKYLRRVSRYNTTKKNQVWSFYFQPFYQLNDLADKSRILVHAHLELLASKWTATTTSSSMFQDTAIIGNNPPEGLVIRHQYNTKSILTINSLSAYLGGGVTYDMKLWNKGEFFISGTAGLTSNELSPSSIDIDSFVSTGSVKKPEGRTWSGFYLVRAYYTQKLNENAQIVVGTDIRGFLEHYAPQYAAYVGLNVGLEAITKLITGEKKE